MPLVVFDLDGTLIDSRRDLADAANALIVERGGTPLPVDAITAMVGEGAPLLVRRALTAAGLDPAIAAALPRFLELYDERLLDHTRLYDGTREALEHAVARGHARRPDQQAAAADRAHPRRPADRRPVLPRVIGGDTPLPAQAGSRRACG